MPYEYVSKQVDVRVSFSKVTIFCKKQVIAEHKRIHDKYNKYSTISEHMPEKHKEMLMPWNPNRYIRWAKKIGPATEKLITELLSQHVIVQQAFAECTNILNLNKRHKGFLEAACAEVISQGPDTVYSYALVKRALDMLEKRTKEAKELKTASKPLGNINDRAMYSYTPKTEDVEEKDNE